MSLFSAFDGVHTDSPSALTVHGESTSWAGLVASADAVAAEIGGSRAVAVSGNATLDTVIAVVAGLRAGVPVVPVPSDAGPMERRHILHDSGAEIVLGDSGWGDVALPTVPTRLATGTGGSAGAPEPPESSIALIMYTSGTTGPPKGAMIPRSAIAAGLDGLARAWDWTPDDHVVHGLPLFHVHGLILGVLGSLRVGSKLTHTGRPTPEAYAGACGSLYFGVPTVWSRVVADVSSARALRGARLLVSGSAPLPVSVFDEMTALTGQAPVERYGMTETLITLSTRAAGERRAGHVGLPIDGVETRLRSDHGELVQHDGATIGGLEVRGDTLFTGYLNLAEATAGAFTDDGWFVTGDAVTIDEGGFHRIVGRASIDIIKTGGFKVGAGEVEAALLTHGSISEAAVVGVPDADLGERIVGYVVGDDADPAALIEHVASLLSMHKRPREVVVVESLPRNAMGKVQKRLLQQR